MSAPVILGDCTLYLGDCLEILPTLAAGSVDAVVTDPPYGINYQSNKPGKFNRIGIEGDGDYDISDAILRKFDSSPMAIFASPTQKIPDWMNLQHVLVWDKSPLPGMGDLNSPWRRDIEFIWILEKKGWIKNGSRLPSVIRGETIVTWSSGPVCRLHPTQKPIGVIIQILDRLDAQTIFDPFMGSGTTGVACVQTGRKFIGIEIDPGYFEIACKRIEKAQQQIRMEI